MQIQIQLVFIKLTLYPSFRYQLSPSPQSQITQIKLRFSYFQSHFSIFVCFYFVSRTASTKINATRFPNGKMPVDVSIWHSKFSYCFRLHEICIMNCCERRWWFWWIEFDVTAHTFPPRHILFDFFVFFRSLRFIVIVCGVIETSFDHHLTLHVHYASSHGDSDWRIRGDDRWWFSAGMRNVIY